MVADIKSVQDSENPEKIKTSKVKHKYPPSIPCDICGAKMTCDEAALNRKYNGRFSEDCLCPECLGKKMGVSADTLRKKIRIFQMQGCLLFTVPQEKDDTESDE